LSRALRIPAASRGEDMEMKVKKREWVKNAAIIFLAVMLLLTFFSNTIMNRSLPEVATQAVASGEITAKIRGTGTVEANESYQVTLDQTRKIDAVKIKVGDEVKKGQVLFTLSAAKSDELSSAQDAVDSAESAYQQALIDATKTSKSAAIKRASEALQDARTNFAAASKVSAAEVAAAKKDYDAKNAVTASLEAEYNKAKAALDNAGGWTPPSGDGGLFLGEYGPGRAFRRSGSAGLGKDSVSGKDECFCGHSQVPHVHQR
jgi:multidrug efflux pump subunit AcrA (membrane-fusion protein)